MDLDVRVIVSTLVVFVFILSFMDKGKRHYL